MGVPMAGCHSAELPFPPFIIQFLLFVSYIQCAVNWALLAGGMRVLPVDNFRVPASSFSVPADHPQSPQARRRPDRHFPASIMIRQALPSSPYEAPPPLPKGECQDPDQIFATDRCAVCLHGLKAGEEVRRLGGCRHVFHACCIDKWVDVGRCTCPLCRAQLMPQELLREAMIAAGKVSGDAATASFDLDLSPSESYYYDDGLYIGNDGDYYPRLSDEFDANQDSDFLS